MKRNFLKKSSINAFNMSQAEVLITMLMEVFNISRDEIEDDATPDDIESWTSVSHMDLMARFEDTFGLELDVEEITEMDSIGAIKDALKNHGIEI
ncbi:hypothetical protein WKT22_03859 [Candidatus Lokiarchaeum ossiferum]